MRILLVDDEPLALEQLIYLITSKWPMWELYTAEDAFQAQQLVKDKKFTLALVDIHLPGKSGLQLIEMLKENDPKLHFIITTAYQKFEYAKKSIQLGVIDYLVKPIIEEELLGVLEKFIKTYGYNLAKSKTVEQVLEIIWEDYASKISLETLAEAVHVSPSYLSKKFSEELGLSLSSFLMKYRIEKAKAVLLHNPDYNLALLAEEVGFQTQSYFSSAFKKYEGITPSQFKELRLKHHG